MERGVQEMEESEGLVKGYIYIYIFEGNGIDGWMVLYFAV